ncbi:unnamed protein product [Diamesa serratosioi]
MDEPELVMQILERFSKMKQNDRDIPRELEEYITFVARTGDSVYHWYVKITAMTKASFIYFTILILIPFHRALVKHLFREKLINVITQFYNDSPNIKELPQYPNVDAFNFETMKKMLIEKLDSFNSAPFTIQRICELLADPRKQYSRIDKFMRAVEKTILVVSTQEPGRNRSESENGDSLDSALNGDFASEVNVEIDMDNESSFSKDFAANRKDQNHEVSTTTTTPTTTIYTSDGTSVTLVKVGTNGSTEKKTEAAVLKTDDEEVKAEVASVSSSDSAKASSSKSETDVNKDEDKTEIDEVKDEEVAEADAEADADADADADAEADAEAEEIAEEDEDEDDEPDSIQIEVPVEMPDCEDTSSQHSLAELEILTGEKISEIIVEVSDPTVIAVMLPLAALESIVAEQTENNEKSTSIKIEHFPDSSVGLSSEDSSSASPDESEIDTKRMKFSDSTDVLQSEHIDSESGSENTASSSTTTSSSSTAESEEQPPVVTTTTIDTILVEKEEDEEEEEEVKAQEVMSTGEATATTSKEKDPEEVEAKPMNEEVASKTEDVAVASSTVASSEMEASSSAAPVENKMSFDEDITSETTEESAPLIPINKMDTETDGDAMDVDESEASSEPMDQ